MGKRIHFLIGKEYSEAYRKYVDKWAKRTISTEPIDFKKFKYHLDQICLIRDIEPITIIKVQSPLEHYSLLMHFQNISNAAAAYSKVKQKLQNLTKNFYKQFSHRLYPGPYGKNEVIRDVMLYNPVDVYSSDFYNSFHAALDLDREKQIDTLRGLQFIGMINHNQLSNLIFTAINSHYHNKMIEEFFSFREKKVSANICDRNRNVLKEYYQSPQPNRKLQVMLRDFLEDSDWNEMYDFEPYPIQFNAIFNRMAVTALGLDCFLNSGVKEEKFDYENELHPYFKHTLGLFESGANYFDLVVAPSKNKELKSIMLVRENPMEISVVNNQVHNTEGPAVIYRDKTKIYAMRNIFVPSLFMEKPEKLTANDLIEINNMEIRRVLIEKMGEEKYLMNLSAKVQDESEFGTLYTYYERLLNRGTKRKAAMVKVKNSTPEPDGTYKDYFLQVPPNTKTARQAVAWSFGKTEKEYSPIKET